MEEALLAWFDSHGRDLPWRRTKDPYAVLVSEVMLQQTQVARVLLRYEAWLERWPTAAALAAAPLADVIRAWRGLGYNRRAVNLHRAAQQIAARGWPDDLTALPGVGRYTADAVARFAFGAPVLPFDTNVRRVHERTEATFGPACAHALMDLGATVCLARVPRCGVCPLRANCPSRGKRYAPLRKQSRFEGSFRQRRAQTLRLVAERPRRLDALDADAADALVRDGLVQVAAGTVFLPGEWPQGGLDETSPVPSDVPPNPPRIAPMARLEDYTFGRVVVDGEEETKDVIVLPERVVRNWWRRDGHALVLDDLEAVLEELPARLIIGTGAEGRMKPDPSTLAQLEERGIEIEVLPTGEAVRRYGASNPAETAAALHLTC
jgi:A/G-specific adenine glycosylase